MEEAEEEVEREAEGSQEEKVERSMEEVERSMEENTGGKIHVTSSCARFYEYVRQLTPCGYCLKS